MTRPLELADMMMSVLCVEYAHPRAVQFAARLTGQAAEWQVTNRLV